MSYIGAKELKASDIRRFDVTGSTSATHTLTWSAPTEQSLIVTINGVKQQEDAYSVSGTTLTLTSALVSTDKLEVIGINDIGTTITPAEGSVTNDHISTSAAIAQSKLSLDITNSDINASAAISLSKLATDPSNASNLASGTVPTARLGSGTADSSVFLRGDQSWAAAGGGKVLQVVNQVYENAEINFTSTSFVDLGTNTDVTITPSSTSNKILYLANIGFRAGGTETAAEGYIKIVRDDTTDLGSPLRLGRYMYSGSFALRGSGSFMYLDSPSTTSAITYSMYGKKDSGAVFHLSEGSTNHTLSVIAMEIEA